MVVCPGDDLATLFPERIAAYGVDRCKLHMLRLADPGFRLSAAVMADLSLARYAGFADLPEAAALKARVAAELPDTIRNGIHLIVVQSADGSLVVGDLHHYARTPDPFAPDDVDELILDEYRTVFAGQNPCGQRSLDRNLRIGKSHHVRRHAFRKCPPCGHNGRHGRQHVIRHRRGGHRRPLQDKRRGHQEIAMTSAGYGNTRGRVRLGRHGGRSRLAGADGRLRRGVCRIRRGHFGRRGARPHGNGQAPAHSRADGFAQDCRRMDGETRPSA